MVYRPCMEDVLRSLNLLWWLCSTSTAWATCPQARTPEDLAATLATAEAAYASLDLPGFRAAMTDVRADLACVDTQLSPHLAAEVHRFEGLHGFVDRDNDRAELAFAAARSVEPHHRLSDALVPEGNPVQELYTALNPHEGGYVLVSEPNAGRLIIDGTATNRRSTQFPAVFQLVADNGRAEQTRYLWPEDAPPDYAGQSVATHMVDPTVVPIDPDGGVTRVTRGGPDRRFLLGAGASAVGALALYGGAFLAHRRYDDPETEVGDLNRLRTTNNVLVLASGTSAAVAVGLGTTAFLVARF